MGLLTGGVSMSLHKEFVGGFANKCLYCFSDYVYISAELSYLMMVIHGCISGVLWRLSRNYISVKIFYSYFIYTFLSFYHESFMTNISSWIQITLCIIVFSQFLKAQKIKWKCILNDLNFSRRDAGFKARKMHWTLLQIMKTFLLLTFLYGVE